MRNVPSIVLLLALVPLATVAGDLPSDLFIGGGGPMPTLLFLDLEDLNSVITDVGYPQISQVFFANGGGGYGGQLDGLRIGGFGLAGDAVAVTGARSVSFDLGYGGMIVEKAVSNDDEFTVVLGTLLGFGGLDLRLVSGIPGTFDEAVTHPFVSSMSKEFFAVQPYIAFESEPFSWMSARFQLGFLWTLADQWVFEEAEFAGPPRTLGGLTASFMVRFGGGHGVLNDMEASIEEASRDVDAMDDLDTDSDPRNDAEEADTD